MLPDLNFAWERFQVFVKDHESFGEDLINATLNDFIGAYFPFKSDAIITNVFSVLLKLETEFNILQYTLKNDRQLIKFNDRFLYKFKSYPYSGGLESVIYFRDEEAYLWHKMQS